MYLPDTIEFAIPAAAPAKYNCELLKNPVYPFFSLKTRFINSKTTNWIETHAPMPTSGVVVP